MAARQSLALFRQALGRNGAKQTALATAAGSGELRLFLCRGGYLSTLLMNARLIRSLAFLFTSMNLVSELAVDRDRVDR